VFRSNRTENIVRVRYGSIAAAFGSVGGLHFRLEKWKGVSFLSSVGRAYPLQNPCMVTTCSFIFLFDIVRTVCNLWTEERFTMVRLLQCANRIILLPRFGLDMHWRCSKAKDDYVHFWCQAAAGYGSASACAGWPCHKGHHRHPPMTGFNRHVLPADLP
jgi:hypothetical protein